MKLTAGPRGVSEREEGEGKRCCNAAGPCGRRPIVGTRKEWAAAMGYERERRRVTAQGRGCTQNTFCSQKRMKYIPICIISLIDR